GFARGRGGGGGARGGAALPAPVGGRAARPPVLWSGGRRSRPNALMEIFVPGADWRRLYSARSTSRNTLSTAAGSWPSAISSSRPRSPSTYPDRLGSSTGESGRESESGGPGRNSPLGGLVMEFSGIGGPSPRRSASALRHRASFQTSNFGTSLSGLNPPTESPYSVEYPTDS